jgi:prophage tail gpP-like protein
VARAYYPRALVALRVLLDGDSNVYDYVVVPREVEVERNHHREADTFELELDYLDFPLDPRAVRSIHVAVLMGDVGEPNQELPVDDERYRVFLGYVDEPETRFAEDGETVRLKGRDYTGLFLDYRWPGNAIDVTQPLSRVLRTIAAQVPGAEGIFMEFSTGAADTILADAIGRTKYTPNANDDAWTIIVELCGLNGLVPVIELDTLVVRMPNEVRQRSVRFLYGRDVSRLSFSRKFNEARTMQVQVIGWNEQEAISETGFYPAEPITRQKVSTKTGKVSTEAAPRISWFVQGAFSKADLEAIAQTIYEDLAREQIEGTLETREMVDTDGTELWQLANGDQVQLRLGKEDLSSIQGMSDAEAIAWLTSGPRAFAVDVARALVAGFRRAETLSTRFYVKKASHRWSRQDGYRLELGFINYVGGG